MGSNRKLPFGYRMEQGRVIVDQEESRWVCHLFRFIHQTQVHLAIVCHVFAPFGPIISELQIKAISAKKIKHNTPEVITCFIPIFVGCGRITTCGSGS